MRGDFYDDEFGQNYRDLARERGDLVVGRHVIRTGIDLMNVAMDAAMETQRLTGERDALRIEVKEANARTADQQVARVQAEADLRRATERLERHEERTVAARTDLQKLYDGVTELAAAYRSSKPTTAESVADALDALLEPEAGDPA